MKLTSEDRVLLLDCGYSESDFPQIVEALKTSKTKYELGDTSISRDEAIELLGRKEFITGVARSAFHFTAARETADGQFVYFDSSNLFRSNARKAFLDDMAGFLEDFFWAQLISMSVDVVDGHLIAKDDEGNMWKDAEIYDFALNECLCFNVDGSLSDGLAAAEPFAERLKEDAKLFGVEVTSIVKTIEDKLADATQRSNEAGHGECCKEEYGKE